MALVTNSISFRLGGSRCFDNAAVIPLPLPPEIPCRHRDNCDAWRRGLSVRKLSPAEIPQ
jgi:hypothetical protein